MTSSDTTADTTSDTTTDAEFEAALQQFVGKEVGPPHPAPDEVNLAMIRHWCEAIGDANPVYLDAAAATASVHGQLVAPPTMLQAWVMSGINPLPARKDSPYEQLTQLLYSRGITSVVATNCEQTYLRYVHLGDRLSMRTFIDSISPQKTTALGVGHFITTRQDYYDEAGELVGTMLFRIIRFWPATKPTPTPTRPPRPEAATTRDIDWWFKALNDGELRVQHCTECDKLRHPPGPMCPSCNSLAWDSVLAPSTGRIHSFAVVHYPVVPSFDYPLPVLLVDLDDMPGIRVVMNSADSAIESLVIGERVRIAIRRADDSMKLPFAIVESAK